MSTLYSVRNFTDTTRYEGILFKGDHAACVQFVDNYISNDARKWVKDADANQDDPNGYFHTTPEIIIPGNGFENIYIETADAQIFDIGVEEEE